MDLTDQEFESKVKEAARWIAQSLFITGCIPRESSAPAHLQDAVRFVLRTGYDPVTKTYASIQQHF